MAVCPDQGGQTHLEGAEWKAGLLMTTADRTPYDSASRTPTRKNTSGVGGRGVKRRSGEGDGDGKGSDSVWGAELVS